MSTCIRISDRHRPGERNCQDLWIGLNPADPDLVVDDGKSPTLEVSQAVPHGLKPFG